VKLKREILEAQTEADAHELANILLKLNPVKEFDAVLERTEQLLIVSLVLAASSHGDNCVQFFLDRLKESDPKQWLASFQGTAKSNLEAVLKTMSDNLRKGIGEQLYVRIGTYVHEQSLR